MISETRLDLRPLDLAAVLDNSVEIYRQNFLMLAGIGAVVYVPFGLLGLVGTFLGEAAHAVLNLLGTMLLLSVWPLVAGALIHGVAERYQGRPATLASSYRGSWQHGLPLIVTAYLVGCAIAVGMLVFGGLVMAVTIGVLLALRSAMGDLPDSIMFGAGALGAAVGFGGGAAIVSVPTTFALHSVMLEDRYYDQSFTRSFELTRVEWPRVLALGVVLWLLQMVLSVVPVMLAGFLMGDTTALNAFSSAWTAVANSALIPIGIVPFVILYFDIRVRQEALDLRVLADRLGPMPPPRQVQVPPIPPGACARCGWAMPAGASFCIGCGAPAAASPAGCRACGARLLPGAAFCTGCGAAQQGAS